VQFNLKNRFFATIIVIICVVVFLNLPYFSNLPVITSSRHIFLDLSYPFYFVFDAGVTGVRSTASGLTGLKNVSSENKGLKEKLSEALAKVKLNSELEEENKHLRQLLGFRQRKPYALLSAQVIARSPSAWFKRVMLDRGSADGVAEGMAVINEEGAVGQIMEVNRHTSFVMLLTDYNSRVSSRTLKSRVLGVVFGQLIYPLQMKYVLGESRIEEGEVVVTADSSIFPGGLPVGRIKTVSRHQAGLFYEIGVSPAVDFSKIEKVFVMLRQ
jgi:rod shape-determining protein MreC